MSPPGPSRKPAHVESDPDPDETGVQTDEQVWFSDGNIVVVAANKVAFRVHKGILSLRSEVFRDMFSPAITDAHAATAESESESVEGCPVVHLTDPPEDIRRLFLVLCCGKNYYYDRDELVPVPFAVLASLIRTAHKYAVQDVLDDALARLKKYYTNDLAAWQDPSSRARHVTTVPRDAPTVLHLARLTNTPSLLPTAFLVCTMIATWRDYQPDGSCVSPIAALSVLDLTGVIVGKGLLVQARATRALHLLGAAPSAHCLARETCAAARDGPVAALRGSSRVFKSSMGDAHALTPMVDIFWPRYSRWPKFCGSCHEALVEEDGMVIRLLWKHLPLLFGLRLDEGCWPSSGSLTWTSRDSRERQEAGK
ncbi:hypothetical protein GSI_11229 [Ganoderma sinense ZZ0214-1]|uniref:BTB domain-containing protein n=1 Tax=Ganoderma sinense ZZ0214-1 TaxID=1077348 RepID=A0A2G8RYW4_9APHY|nr:hypothetical protein GSI_11229 [Ganoderma sinense ZZ0214-1]